MTPALRCSFIGDTSCEGSSIGVYSPNVYSPGIYGSMGDKRDESSIVIYGWHQL